MSSAFHEKSQHFPPFFTHIAPQDGKTTVAIPNKGICPTTRKEITTMSTKNSNKLNIPEAKAAMDKFKMEAASEVGVNLKDGYNGHLTSREAGSVGGQMVKNVCPIRTARFTRNNRIMEGHMQAVRYIATLTV